MRKPTFPVHAETKNRPRNLGTSLDDHANRLDAVAKVTGAAKYGRDKVAAPNTLFAAFVRCPYGAATLTAHDADAARAVDGVVDVEITRDDGRYHGHPVGHVAARSREALRRGLRALACEWKRGTFEVDLEESAGDSADLSADTRDLLDGADFVLDAVYSTPVQTHSSLETHGAMIDHTGDAATCWISTQGTFAARDGLGEALGLPQSKFEVMCEYVGGGFGSKLNGAGKEGTLAARLAAKHRCPVYVFVDRAGDHLDTGNRPSSRTAVRIGFDRTGRVLGGQVCTWGSVGVGRGGGGVRIPSERYDLGRIERHHDDVRLNAGPPRPFRAPGSPQGAFAEELMLDEIATIAGVDPLALRLDHEKSADRKEMFELGAEIIGWRDRARTGTQDGVVRRGFGLGSTSWGRFPSQSEAEVVVHRDGSVEARTGTQDIGTGQRTIMGIVAATTLGVPLEAVRVQIGRSTLPPGPGSGGSVTAHNTAPSMQSAAEDAKSLLLGRIAERLELDPANLDIAEGTVLQHGEPVMTWTEACRTLPGDGITGRGRWDRGTRRRDRSTGHSEGVQFVDLRVDTETGVVTIDRIVAVQACGQVIARKTAESQIIGGVIQGVSYALFEDKVMDAQLGAMINPNFEWYKIAGTADMPHIEPVLWTKGQTGVRSLGEPPTIPTAGAIAGALYNALGAPVRHLPLTPDKVLAALDRANEGAPA